MRMNAACRPAYVVRALLGLAIILSPALALAQQASDADGVAVKVRLADLSTADGRLEVHQRLESAADAYCKGSPPGMKTVYSCRRDTTEAMLQDLAEKARGYRMSIAAAELPSR